MLFKLCHLGNTLDLEGGVSLEVICLSKEP
jgi:hypothetical protein